MLPSEKQKDECVHITLMPPLLTKANRNLQEFVLFDKSRDTTTEQEKWLSPMLNLACL
jgi:hypothetical protein